jgi:hypothetical protein
VSDVLLTPEQQQRIRAKGQAAAARGRVAGAWGGAAGFNQEMKRRRLAAAQETAAPIVRRLAANREALMLLAAGLYMGEGAKDPDRFVLVNSDSRIIRLWLALLRGVFGVADRKLRCQVDISEGMDELALRAYWSGVTGIPISQFIKGSVRPASGGRKRDAYRGVCVIICHSIDVRRLVDAVGEGVIDEMLRCE